MTNRVSDHENHSEALNDVKNKTGFEMSSYT